jgi:hypothetical protein
LGIKEEFDWFGFFQGNYDKLVAEMKAANKSLLDSKIKDKPCSHDLKDYCGTYTEGGYGAITISVKKGKLHAKYHENELDLEHLHYETFIFDLFVGALPLTFSTNPKGEVESFTLPAEASVKPLVFKRI